MTGAKLRRGSTPYRTFITEIDGLDIHFIHVRSRHENALPLIVTHGWPGSVIEQLRSSDRSPIPRPWRSASDAFHLVIPSMPGYGFSGKPTTTGWAPSASRALGPRLMRRLGYKHFVAQGGDWGSVVTDLLGVQAPPELLGIHTNMPGAIPADINQASSPVRRRRQVSLPRREARTNSSFSSTSSVLRLLDGNAPANNDRVCDSPSASRPSCSTTTRAVWSSSRVRSTGRRRPHAGRCPRQCHAVLANQHRGFVSSPLLGE